MFPRDAFEEVADPALLLLLRVGQQKQLFGSGYVVVHCQRNTFELVRSKVKRRKDTDELLKRAL